jgi:hypothetical protein
MTTTGLASIKREGVKYGIINGLIETAIYYCSYYIGFDTFMKATSFQRYIPYMMIILVLGGLYLRKRRNGYLDFKEGIQFAFLAYVIAGLISAIGIYILYNQVDPELTGKSIDYTVKVMEEKMQVMGSGADEIKEMLDEAKKGARVTGFREVFLGYGYQLIFGFISALIVAVIIKKDRPQEA